MGADRTGGVSGIERIRNEDRRRPWRGFTQFFAASAARKRPSRVPLSTSTSVRRIERALQLEAAAEPVRDALPNSSRPLFAG
jgi:hypothetical protein